MFLTSRGSKPVRYVRHRAINKINVNYMFSIDYVSNIQVAEIYGGEGGIRIPDTLSGMPVFKMEPSTARPLFLV
jgi:hypothetical protein